MSYDYDTIRHYAELISAVWTEITERLLTAAAQLSEALAAYNEVCDAYRDKTGHPIKRHNRPPKSPPRANMAAYTSINKAARARQIARSRPRRRRK